MKRALDWKRVLFTLLLAMICLIAGSPVYAGGPRWIAGSSYFNSPTESRYPAEDLVNAAMSTWSSVPTAAVKFVYSGVLARM